MQPADTEPAAIAARLWPGRRVRFEPLGGVTNRNLKVTVDGETFVLRVGGTATKLLGIDRDAERAAVVAAAEAGVAPEVVAFVEPPGCLVTRYVQGEPVEAAQMREPHAIAKVADVLRRVHTGPPIPSQFDVFRVVETYRASAVARGGRIPAEYERLKPVADMIERLVPPHPIVPCHNHLLNSHVIEDGTGRIWLVDWEYAGMGDRFLDLATFAVEHDFSEDEDAVLQAAYGVEDERSLVHMRFMSDLREAMWGVVQGAISAADFDFGGYAAAHLERAQRTADSDRFRRAML